MGYLTYTQVTPESVWNAGIYYEPKIEANSNIKLRVSFIGTHGPSEWSNVVELNCGGTQTIPEESKAPAENDQVTTTLTEENCSICGFCPLSFGLCIFIWIAILLAIIIIVVVIVIVAKPKKCKACASKLSKNDKCCPKCGKPVQKSY